MRKLFTSALAIALVAVVAASPLLAKSIEFRLSQDSTLNGTTLKAGTYRLELNGESEAVIYNTHSKVPLVKAAVVVKDRQNGASGASVLRDLDGNLLEVRSKKQVVVFVR